MSAIRYKWNLKMKYQAKQTLINSMAEDVMNGKKDRFRV